MSGVILAFTVPGPPVPKGRPRFPNGQAYTPAKARAYERHLALLAQSALSSLPAWNPAGPHELVVRVFRLRGGGELDAFVTCCSDALIRCGVIEAHQSVVRVVATLAGDRARPRLEVEVRCLGFGAEPSSAMQPSEEEHSRIGEGEER